MPSAPSLDIQHIQEALTTRLLGADNRIRYESVVGSTNSLAMKLAQEGAAEGIVVLTDSQSAGRGRQGRQWIDATGMNVLSSTLLYPAFSPHLLVMIAALAVVDAITDTTSCVAGIKWPNDVLIADQKVAGILIETSHDRSGRLIAIVGIGVNINGQIRQYIKQKGTDTLDASTGITGLETTATTLEEASGHSVSREFFIARLLSHIETRYLALQHEARRLAQGTDIASQYSETPEARRLWKQWRDRLSILGRAIQVHQGNEVLSGVAEDVNDQGELLLHRHSGEHVRISWGDVEIDHTTDHTSAPFTESN